MTQTQQEFPKAMVHPAYHKAQSVARTFKYTEGGKEFTDYDGEPDRFPPVTVSNEQQEAYHRAMGYIGVGERISEVRDYSEYPLMLTHPKHEDAVAAVTEGRRKEDGTFETYQVPGRPEKFPHVTVNNPDEEKAWTAKGYRRPGKADADAVETAHAAPYEPERKFNEFPKMVQGKVVDPNRPPLGPIEYPKWVGDKLVNSREEEDALLASMPKAAAPKPVEHCVICGDEIGEGEQTAAGKNGKYHLTHFAPPEHAGQAAVAVQMSDERPPALQPQKAKKPADPARSAAIKAGLAKRKAEKAAADAKVAAE